MADTPSAYRFTNIFGLRFGDNDVVISFGIDESLDAPGTQVSEQSRVIMTPRSAKILAAALVKTIAAFEAENGEIVVPGGKIEALDAAIQSGKFKAGG